MIHAWIAALIAVGCFAAGAFIAWDHLRPGRREIPPEPEEETDDGES